MLRPIQATDGDQKSSLLGSGKLGGDFQGSWNIAASSTPTGEPWDIASDELRNYATVVAALVALLVFVVNTWSQSRNRRIENLSRFNQVHQQLFTDNGYLSLNLAAIENGTMQRDFDDATSEARFHLMLLGIERLAVLANNKAVPRSTQVYMLGSYAPTLLKLMTEEERSSMFWELARLYLEGIAADAERYAKLDPTERQQFWR